MSTVDVAIVAYRGWEHTSSCLEHLRAQTIEHRVIVCDNGCDQGTAGRLERSFPEVEIVRMQRNKPYAVACNAAVASGSGALVVMMNNDVDARPDFLARLLAPFTDRPELGSVAPLLLSPGERSIDSVGLVADPTLAGFPRFHGRPPAAARGAAPGAGPVLTGPAGAAAAFRRSAWQQAGGLDESIFAYLEDFDLALRLHAGGWATDVALDAVAVHVGSATFGHRSHEQRRKLGHARAYCLRRYRVLRSRSAPRALLTEAIVTAADTLISRDLAALSGRRAGWRDGAGHPPLAWPPAAAVDQRIGFLDSIRLRRAAYVTPPTQQQGEV
jgi:N-acetylglucosaminyl-diphospho-decaprenol L-rhamnosyltransferase